MRRARLRGGLPGHHQPFDATTAPGGLDRPRRHRTTAAGGSTTRQPAATRPAATAASPSSTATTSAAASSQDTTLTSPVVDLSDHGLAGAGLRHRLPRLLQPDRRRGRHRRRRHHLDQRLGAQRQRTSVSGHAGDPAAAGRRQVRRAGAVPLHRHAGPTGGRSTTSSSAPRNCDPVPGGLVVGNGDRRQHQGRRRRRHGDQHGRHRPTTRHAAATPDDPNLGDGFYWMFSSVTGKHTFTAAKAATTPTPTKTVNVAADCATKAQLRAQGRAGSRSPRPASTRRSAWGRARHADADGEEHRQRAGHREHR